MGDLRRRLDHVGGDTQCLELPKAALACRVAGRTLVLEIGDRGQRVEDPAETGAQLPRLVARRGCRAPGALGLEVELLHLGGIGRRGGERRRGVSVPLEQLLGDFGLQQLEHRGVAAEGSCRTLDLVDAPARLVMPAAHVAAVPESCHRNLGIAPRGSDPAGGEERAQAKLEVHDRTGRTLEVLVRLRA